MLLVYSKRRCYPLFSSKFLIGQLYSNWPGSSSRTVTFTISVNVNQLSCYKVPSLRDLKATGKAENQATRKSPCTYLINLLQVYIHEQIDPEKGQTSEPLVSFLPGR